MSGLRAYGSILTDTDKLNIDKINTDILNIDKLDIIESDTNKHN